MLDKLKLLLSVVVVAVAVALTYYVFEYAVHHSITYIWDTVFDTATNRLLVVPLCIVGALLFFGWQHYLDPKSENKEEHSLGGDPIKPTLRNFAVILFIGYFSLVGGASLGPEAILVPSCTLIGTFVAVRLFKKNELASKALAAAAVMALFTAFFHSYIVGILSVFLVLKIGNAKLNPQLLLIAVISSVTSYLVLNTIDPEHHYFNFPNFSWKVALLDLAVGLVLIAVGYLCTYALKYTHGFFVSLRADAKFKNWWQLAIIAGLVLSMFYLIGGPLVEFTGNQSVAPLMSQASSLGITGVLSILIVKLLVIGWSKAMGYRGGLIFPMVFVAATLVAIAQLLFNDINFGVAMIAAMIGIFAAESKAHILL